MEIAATDDKQKYTYDDYIRLDDDNRYEVVEGELLLTPSPGFKHQDVVRKLAGLLSAWIEGQNLGVVITAPFDVVLARDTVLQPDIVYLARENYHRLTNACLQGAPDLVIEVISPSTIRRDRIRKSRLYLKHGVKEYWLVDPEGGTVEIFTYTPEGWRLAGTYSQEEILNSPLLPELAIDLNAVFTHAEGLSSYISRLPKE
ncbi:Uma2 family endonuclease [Neomoorella thermoacetica]|uniref:Uma2 family endonuclease n=1 Tax=Neomoorella thermoacetica TaxID=1525 RepID=UPI0008FB15D4|nr:Uma2 family endonuclease [Moorella thermoacetica]APC09542.1 hypothetical protein MTJW_23970 [Moorella thermoacetica]